MPSYEYRLSVAVPAPSEIQLGGNDDFDRMDLVNTWTPLGRRPGGSAHEIPWTHDSAVRACRLAVSTVAGATFRIERRRAGHPRRGQDAGWVPRRAYLLCEDGIVRRTDR